MTNLKYRREIDGLRAVSIIPVVLFHSDLAFFSGGFLGVDVFFVISGYLISTIIFDELERGDFSILRFYERRARRILPALFFVLLITTGFSFYWLFPSQVDAYSESLLSTVLFLSNFYFSYEVEYFSGGESIHPLLHTWSLAVEEQFYIIFPVLAFVLWRFGYGLLSVVVIAITAFSLGLAQFGGNLRSVYPYFDQDLYFTNVPYWAFFMPFTRAWELAAGVLCSIWIKNQNGPQSSNWASGLGLVLIVFSMLMYSEATPHPSFYTLVPVVGAALIILFCTPETLAYKLLASRVMVGIGLISYSTYLWHQPLFTLAKARSVLSLDTALSLLLIALSFFLAYLTWRFVEQPFRKRQNAKPVYSAKTILGLSVSGSLFFIGASVFASTQEGFRDLENEKALSLVNIQQGYNPRQRDVCVRQADIKSGLAPCIYGNQASPAIALIGDSHAGVMAWEIAEELNKSGYRLDEYSLGGCLPVRGLYRVDEGQTHPCPSFNENVYKNLEQHDYAYIIVVARWPLYYHGTGFDNTRGGVEQNATFVDQVGHISAPDDEDRKSRVLESYRQGIMQLMELGSKIILIDPVPEVGWNVPVTLAKIEKFNAQRDLFPLEVPYDAYKNRIDIIKQLFEGITHSNLVRFDSEQYLCVANSHCQSMIGDEPAYFDSNHLTPQVIKKMSHDIMKVIQN